MVAEEQMKEQEQLDLLKKKMEQDEKKEIQRLEDEMNQKIQRLIEEKNQRVERMRAERESSNIIKQKELVEKYNNKRMNFEKIFS